jgi:glycine reductase complex component B subunit alpha and beta
MRLELASYPVRTAMFGERTALVGDHLVIDRDALRDRVARAGDLTALALELVHPGDSARVIHVLDAVEPRLKVDGPGTVFPGFLGAPRTVGAGRTHRLSGFTVLTSALLGADGAGLLTAREAVIDMAGPGAAYCPFAQTVNLVLSAQPAPGVPEAEFDAALRLAVLTAASYLAEATREAEPARVAVHEAGPLPGLPRVVYVDQIQSQGLFAQTYIYGANADQLLPTVIHPNELLDGALVSGNYVYGCMKTPTALHSGNPIVAELLRRHGESLAFCGVVLAKGHNYSTAAKERSATYAAKLAGMLGADGVILTQEGGGNANIDLMLTVHACEQRGMRTTLLANEHAGVDGRDQPLLSAVAEADAIVSVGSYDEAVELPAVDRVVGGDRLRDGRPAAPALQLSLDQLYCSTNQLGAGRLAAEEY